MDLRYAKAARYLSSMKGRTLITFQSVADPDAVASAIAVSRLVSQPDIRATGQLDSASKSLLRSLGLAVMPLESLDGYSNIVITDACTLDSLGKWAQRIGSFKGKRAFIDHHVHSDRMKADFTLELPSVSSTSEIVLRIMDAARKRPDRKTAMLLAAGIASDTGHWKSANQDSFEAMTRLLRVAGRRQDYQNILSLIERPKNPDITIKKIECASHARVVAEDGIIIALSTSDSYYLQCAIGLIELGADYAFVADAQKGIVLGARSDSARKSIGKLMQRVAAKIGGSGGGHEKVGGARGRFKSAGTALDYCASFVLA